MSNLQKTEAELELMKASGQICSEALKKVLDAVKEGVTTLELDDIARGVIEKRGAKPSFMTVDDYKYTICTTINDQVVHGIPTERKLKNGDILGIDIGALYKGFHSDLAISVPVGSVTGDVQNFLDIGKSTLKKAIKKAVIGNKIGDISSQIQESIEKAGFNIVKNLTGHGVGRELHEEPMVPGFGKKGIGQELLENMVIAIEVIYTAGTGEVVVEEDNWTISAEDGSLGGLFEQTIAIKTNGPIVLTPYL